MNSECAEFLHSVKLAFPGLHKKEKRFFTDFSSSVNDYVSEHPDCTKEDLITQFGNPKDIAMTYYSNMDADVYFAILKRNRFIKATCIACIIALTALLITAVCFLVDAKNTYEKITIDYTDTNITEIKN